MQAVERRGALAPRAAPPSAPAPEILPATNWGEGRAHPEPGISGSPAGLTAAQRAEGLFELELTRDPS